MIRNGHPTGYINKKRSSGQKPDQRTLKVAAACSPTVRSTIGDGGLNFSVRNGKRWNPNAITTLISLRCLHAGQSNIATLIQACSFNISTRFHGNESFGLLVLLGFDITALTPVAYQGRSLQPPL